MVSSCAPNIAGRKEPTKDRPVSGVETVVKNEDGEITGIGGASGGDKYYDAEDADLKVCETAASADVASEGEIFYDGLFHTGVSTGGGQINYTAGTLTGAELRDNRDWSDFLTVLNNSAESQIAEDWKLPVFNRVAVTVKNGNTPLRGAKVVISDNSGTQLWSAVSDHDGHAYLFLKTSVPANGATIKVNMDGAKDVSLSYDGSNEITVELDGENSGVKLDLMLMIDTTGSMGDELEYLKAELRDVVTRAQSESGVQSVRTSVNFYRDDGDEYIVRYFAFKDTVDEAVANLAAQSSNGGGDYPEAVHTALDNAINGHAWDKDSVKLMFLVLDAPPHQTDDVIDSISDSIARAAEMGIRVIPVMSSGSDTTCEILFRSIAALTGGSYVFLTDDSGIGYPHEKPTTSTDYEVEKLNDLMVRIISEYCK